MFFHRALRRSSSLTYTSRPHVLKVFVCSSRTRLTHKFSFDRYFSFLASISISDPFSFN
ncbi:hypothetical protein C1H46_018627 [Malus baccata]|uniref:Uncharacterized protein n=1 Tax=Malus baccata TaxID=106549 RepID=A0A540MAT1_MALBA|nr:hypothetical protein C1H46_018627 [Malus baccata]